MSKPDNRHQDQKWSDGFLNQLRAQGDEAAAKCLDAIGPDEAGGFSVINSVFGKIQTNRDRPPDDAPEALKQYWSELRTPELDEARIRRGQDVFLEHGVLCVIGLLNKSLLEGYASPALSQILSISEDLEKRTFRRLMAVLQMVLDVLGDDGFEPQGRACVTAAKLRLLHEGIRRITRRKLPDYEDKFDVPVNHEDMLATLMGFSLLPIEALRDFSADVSPQDEEDLFYPWQVFGYLMGLPREAIPDNVADAQAFYAEYRRRHFVDASKNPDGPDLAAADLKLLESVLPSAFGLKTLPRIICQRLMTRESLERVRVEPVKGHWTLKTLLNLTTDGGGLIARIPLLNSLFHRVEKVVCYHFLSLLVRFEYEGVPPIIVPSKVSDLWRM